MADLNAQALRDLAEAHLAAILNRLPSDRLNRFVLFMEVVRAMDYWGINAQLASKGEEKVEQSLDLMYWGWNRAVAELFEPLDQLGAFPLMKSTHESRGFAAGLMQEFGKVSLARRLADMSERSIMEIARDGDEFQIRMSEHAKPQFADAMEFDRLRTAEERTPASNSGWTMAAMRDAVRFPDMPEHYFGVGRRAGQALAQPRHRGVHQATRKAMGRWRGVAEPCAINGQRLPTPYIRVQSRRVAQAPRRRPMMGTKIVPALGQLRNGENGRNPEDNDLPRHVVGQRRFFHHPPLRQ